MSDRQQGSGHTSADAAALRKRAEDHVRAMETISVSAQTPEAIQRVFHELRVHQIELEMQNEDLRAAQAEIEAARARYFDLYDLAPVGYCTLSKQGLIVEANLTAAALLGVTRGALVNQPISRFIIKEDQDIYYLQRKKLFETGEPQKCELRLLKPDGALFWAHLTATAVQVEDGSPVCRVAFSDITERKQAEQSLRQSEVDVREAQRLAHVGSWRLNVETNQVVWSEELYRMLGFDPALAPPPYTEHMKLFSPESWDRLSTSLARTRETGVPYELELEMAPKGGRKGWMWVRGEAVKDETGRIIGLWGASQDITERKLAEESIRESELKFRTLVEASSSGIWRTDAAGRNTYVSPRWCEITGMSEADAAGQGWASGLHPDDRIPVRIGWENAATAVKPYTSEFRFVSPGGRLVWVLCQASPVMKGDHVAEWIGTITDITERKRAEAEQEKLQAELSQAQKMESVGRLAGGVAHDFNNMLQVILSHTEMALELVAPAEEFLHADLEEIKEAAQRSADLTRQLLAFARKQTIAPRVLDLNDNIESMLKMLRRLIGEDIDLSWKPRKGLWPVKMDPSQIDQILANLCVNARDAIANVGNITIETDNTSIGQDYCALHAGFIPGDYVLLALSDNGCGMGPETLPHIFEPFFTTKETGKGTGLGLATIYGAVKQNNGFIDVYSEPGYGTRFTIYLPRHAAESTHLPMRAPAQPEPCGGETILLVEDDPAVLGATKMMLERQGYTVLEANTPGEAIRLAAEHSGRIDLLMADVVMPEMNGRDLAENILSLYPDLRRLYMSGYTADVIVHHGVIEEGVQFIQKPFSMQGLAAKLREALSVGFRTSVNK